ncbi:GL22784 [Drosophila persimilis]|uniref:GL22784 n=1 Tax=Drosophila persimilis TaxID=7234 RepID=B4GZK6_DROPE|nr:GL22784 [Drosophila persimilis]
MRKERDGQTNLLRDGNQRTPRMPHHVSRYALCRKGMCSAPRCANSVGISVMDTQTRHSTLNGGHMTMTIIALDEDEDKDECEEGNFIKRESKALLPGPKKEEEEEDVDVDVDRAEADRNCGDSWRNRQLWPTRSSSSGNKGESESRKNIVASVRRFDCGLPQRSDDRRAITHTNVKLIRTSAKSIRETVTAADRYSRYQAQFRAICQRVSIFESDCEMHATETVPSIGLASTSYVLCVHYATPPERDRSPGAARGGSGGGADGEAAAPGITVPIVVGQLVADSFRTYCLSENIAGVHLPPGLRSELLAIESDAERVSQFFIQLSIRIIRDILAADVGVYGVQFYTFNQFAPVQAVLKELRTLDILKDEGGQ